MNYANSGHNDSISIKVLIKREEFTLMACSMVIEIL